MSLWQAIRVSLGNQIPAPFGWMAGFIMTNRPSNVERNEWGISLLQIKPSDFVLEIGFGPGVAIRRISKLLTNGIIYGIDHSSLMLKQASKRNREAIQLGKVKLALVLPVTDLPLFENHFDKILDVNSFQFWCQLLLNL